MEPSDPNDVDPFFAERERGRLERIAAVHREIAEMEAANRAAAGALEPRRARPAGISRPYSIRLDRYEIDALEERAAARGLRPTVLARNFIRMGLAQAGPGDVADAIWQVAAALDDLRTVVGLVDDPPDRR